MKKVTVCIVSLNCILFLKKCIKNLKKSTKVPIEIIVLDLGNDETYEWCKSEKIQVFRKKLPFYFAQSNNFLASKVKTDLILFLNPDTEPQKNFLEKMIKEMDESNADIVGCKLLFPWGTIQHAGVVWEGYQLPRHIGYNDLNFKYYSDSYDVEGVTSACMLIKKKVFKKIGGFDDGFKNGYEDMDLCIKARNKGYKIRYCGKANVIHYEGSTMGTEGKERTSLQFFEYNKNYLLKKYKKI